MMETTFSFSTKCLDSWHFTAIPLGKWVSRTAVDLALTFIPPAPEDRMISFLRSLGEISTSG